MHTQLAKTYFQALALKSDNSVLILLHRLKRKCRSFSLTSLTHAVLSSIMKVTYIQPSGKIQHSQYSFCELGAKVLNTFNSAKLRMKLFNTKSTRQNREILLYKHLFIFF